jgi:hypothetical protein
VRKFVCTSLSATLLLTVVSPAFGRDLSRDFGFQGANMARDDAATATVDYRIPFGGKTSGKANYGVSLNFGPRAADEGFKPTVRLADLRFGDEGVQNARVGGYDFAQRGADLSGDKLTAMEGKDSTTWIIIGLVVAGAVVWAVASDDDDDD